MARTEQLPIHKAAYDLCLCFEQVWPNVVPAGAASPQVRTAHAASAYGAVATGQRAYRCRGRSGDGVGIGLCGD
jgi:hypothetical protein